VQFSSTGTRYIRYYSRNHAGNNETVQYREIRIDRAPPSVTPLSPANRTKYRLTGPKNISWSVRDDYSAYMTCTLYLNGTAVNTSTVPNDTVITVPTPSLERGRYAWQVYCNDSAPNSASTPIFNFSIKAPIFTHFEVYTDTSKFLNDTAVLDLESMENASVENGNGIITWTGAVDSSEVNYDLNVLIVKHSIVVNSSGMDPSMNSSANLVMYNVTLSNPILLLDGGLCTVCTNIDFNPAAHTLSFSVPHFSNYTAMDNLTNSTNMTNTTFADHRASIDGNITFLDRFGTNTSNNITTEGGNISFQGVAASTLTDRWAGLYGNVSGHIYLTDADTGTSAPLYSWDVSDPNRLVVCASTSDAYQFVSSGPGTGADVDSAWGFGGALDNASNTFNTTTCSLILIEGIINNTGNAKHQGASTFSTCLAKSGSGKGSLAFCTAINQTGRSFNNQTSKYELIVPTSFGTGIVETYYMYAELG
jgi:hypothetical protein